nr:MAG: RNA-dependent RNA-polymerase [Picobirnavirus sp.]
MKLPKEFLAVISQNNGLKQYLSSLSTGRDFTPRSWLYENQDPDQILNNWLNVLSQLESGDTFEKNVYQFDTSQMKKWGPQGGIAPIQDLLTEIVLPTFARDNSPIPKAFDTREWHLAKQAVRDQFYFNSVRGIRQASYSNVVADMRARDTLESNSGWPDFARRNRPEVLKAALAAAADGEALSYPAIALFRNYNQKTRLVWMFPEGENILEGSYCQPLQSRIINSGLSDYLYAPWKGFECVRDAITEAYDQGKFLAASDFSSTDAHFQLRTTEQVFDVLRYIYQKQVNSGVWATLQRMHTIPLITGTDEMLTGEHGVSSGSNWTNFIETVFDHIFSYFINIGYDRRTIALCAIGDDICWCSSRFDDAFDKNLEQLGKEVGQEINAEKVTNEEDQVKFLQRLFQRRYRRSDGKVRAVYSTVRALKSSVYPERFHKPSTWNSDMFCARQYMILENCVDHPLFEAFVKFVVEGQKDLIPFARKSETELKRITRETKLIPGFNPTYNQEKRDSSLASFKSIEIARMI